MNPTITIFWFRRDLRLNDNHGLWQALKEKKRVLPIFIFDTTILDQLPKKDRRISFIMKHLTSMNETLKSNYNSGISIFHGDPLEIFKQLSTTYQLEDVYCNLDYEPYGIERDSLIKMFLNESNINFNSFKDHLIHDPTNILKSDQTPYVVYTPFSKLWISKYAAIKDDNFPSETKLEYLISKDNNKIPTLNSIGFERASTSIQDFNLTDLFIDNYEANRDFPYLDSSSKLGPHLRFGTVSVREIAKKAYNRNNRIFLKALIWREFFIHILYHFPHSITKAFKPKYDAIRWRNDPQEFEAWCNGETGYPLVDAGMRELNATGYMHNRVRMVAASFLCKHLLIDWRWGEAYFAHKLNDFELASNVGNWQWVAGTGVDAAPYFRIFNPIMQLQKFDKQHQYISKWVNDFSTEHYPEPIVDHKTARLRCLETYKNAIA
ncbi:MAG: deoxyribodipyrimidine photolyase [Bacteroidetes bacterium MedPE-SWsnd-G2]|nr:MAG: deoxyribodipyrimidine photolyase [Bacteroidetes bacterium MedPE-SWsnd-G2]